MRQLASEITKKGASIHQILDQEMRTKNQRHQVLQRNYELGQVETALQAEITSMDQRISQKQEAIDSIASTEASLDQKLEKKIQEIQSPLFVRLPFRYHFPSNNIAQFEVRGKKVNRYQLDQYWKIRSQYPTETEFIKFGKSEKEKRRIRRKMRQVKFMLKKGKFIQTRKQLLINNCMDFLLGVFITVALFHIPKVLFLI